VEKVVERFRPQEKRPAPTSMEGLTVSHTKEQGPRASSVILVTVPFVKLPVRPLSRQLSHSHVNAPILAIASNCSGAA
jgi:hypothetical protein